ncbi:phenolic glucoside malonyltransferase 1-like [Salvia miltiorrhiza]|uniref:phenolic glucoside malonyltransferase 1-like n=1 Tax=Salvia miltiorrhiza TaxID=226208 RepID=UPI0025AD3E65|nr:phenolic glucoside malonyltransferase 1-like [Salvia miltiorrhiza]
MAIKLENCRIYPSSSRQFCTPLTHFDIPFLQSDPTKRLIFFDLPCSDLYFHEHILPSLKNSLSLTLAHFLPLAGNVVLLLNSGSPMIRCVAGDSVSLIAAQSDQDLHYLASHHQRVADHFYECVPELPLATRCADFVVFPVVALQITLFAGQGICIGITNHHAVADGSSIVNFVKSWGCANRSRDAEEHLPVFDRALVEDPEKLDSIAWKFVKNRNPHLDISPSVVEFPINRIRSTLLLTKNQIEILKNHVYAKTPNLGAVSSFTVISAYAWICSLKAAAAPDDDDDEIVYFSFAANCRGRLNPPLPESYFGNCLVFVRAGSRRGSLRKEGGFVVAVESIREASRRILQSDRGVVESADWPLDFRKYSGQWRVSVAGSPRFDVYEADFGWGKAKKQEFVHIDRDMSISLCKSRDFEGGFEIGVSRKKAEMDVFERVFGDMKRVLESDGSEESISDPTANLKML